MGKLASLFRFFYYVFEGILELVFPAPWIRKPQYSVRGKTALVTGAANGIGRETALELAKHGSNLVLLDLNEDGMREVAEKVKNRGRKCEYFVCDMSSKDEIQRVAQQVLSAVGKVDILVNNAGIALTRPLLESTDTQIEKMIQINLLAHFWTIRAFLPEMIRQKSGHIVSVASGLGLAAAPNLSAYCSAKFGVVGLHESVRKELEVDGLGDKIGMTCVCPGVINTRMTDAFSATNSLLRFLSLGPEKVAAKIVESIQYRSEMLLIPTWVQYSVLLRNLLPTKAMLELQMLFGMEQMTKTSPKISTLEMLPNKS